MKYQSILIISDLHCPYNHPDSIAFLKALKSKYRPDKVLMTGDEMDFHSLSFHDHDPNLPSAGYEIELGKIELKKLMTLFPKVDILESNHGSLVYRKALANGLPDQVFKSYNEILDAPKGWKWHFDLTIDTPMGKTYFHHSKGANVKRNSMSMGMNFVQGHHHESFEICYWGNPNALLYGMTVGCLVNPKALALAYNRNNLKRPVIGCAVIINGIPQLVPMQLIKNGRWTGRL